MRQPKIVYTFNGLCAFTMRRLYCTGWHQRTDLYTHIDVVLEVQLYACLTITQHTYKRHPYVQVGLFLQQCGLLT